MTSLRTGPSTPGLHRLYIPAVCALILFQGYYSQHLFAADPNLAPGPLTRREAVAFNALLACLWWTYYCACAVDPGRYVFPPSATRSDRPGGPGGPDDALRRRSSSSSSSSSASSPPPAASSPAAPVPPLRWCKKCSAPKPLRAHHCRHCGRCIPKMDHHCPWTGNCVSLQTFPYFLRFLVYANVALWYLARQLWRRAARVWADRALPAYLGPRPGSLAGLTVLALLNAGTIVALGILLYATVKGWLFNCTMIEEWEVERHEAVLARMYRNDDDDVGVREAGSYHQAGGAIGVGGGGSYFWGDDDAALRSRLERIEFPYDLGVFANMAQAMGTRNPLRWLLPAFGGGPVVASDTPGRGVGWEWEENGFNDLPGLWPPPDPEKLRQERAGGWPGAASRRRHHYHQQDHHHQEPWEGQYDEYQTAEEIKAAFARRQEEDRLRRQRAQARQARQQRAGIIAELEEIDEADAAGGMGPNPGARHINLRGRPSWTNSDGDRLWDYGVDEDVEEDIVPSSQPADDNVPLAELIRRRKVLTRDEDDG